MAKMSDLKQNFFTGCKRNSLITFVQNLVKLKPFLENLTIYNLTNAVEFCQNLFGFSYFYRNKNSRVYMGPQPNERHFEIAIFIELSTFQSTCPGERFASGFWEKISIYDFCQIFREKHSDFEHTFFHGVVKTAL